MSGPAEDAAGASRGNAPPLQLVVVTLLLGLGAYLVPVLSRMGDAPPEAYGIFQRLFYFNDAAGALAMLVAFVVALKMTVLQRGVSRAAACAGEHPGAVCAATFVALAAGSRFFYLAHPFSMDEYAPMLQAHAFAQGELVAHYPPALLDRLVWPGFQNTFVLVDKANGLAASAYWPGLALLLTPFALVHAAWALNPALSALALALVGDLAARAGKDADGAPLRRGWAMLAALACPAFVINGISFYAMPGLLALNLLYLWLLLRADRRSALAAGVVGSLALVMHNPLPHALMALPCLLWLAAGKDRRRRLPFVIAGYAPLALLLGLGWPMLTSAMHMARAYATGEHVGFVQEWATRVNRIFLLPSLDLLEARRAATWKIWIWACPGLALAPFVVRPRTAAQGLLLAAFMLTYAAYFLVPFDQGHGWGYRYVHPVWGVLPIAGGVWFARAGAARSFGAIAVAAGLLAMPVFLWQTHATIALALSRRIEPPAEGRWVVFVNLQHRYSMDLIQNLPGRDRVLYFVSQGAASDRALMATQFPQAAEAVRDVRGSAWRWTAPAR